MSGLQASLHVINLIVFGIVLLVWSTTARTIMQSNFHPTFRNIGLAAAFGAMALTVSFVALQLDWIISSHNAAVGDVTSFSWLIFDYALAFFMLIMGCWSQVNIALLGPNFRDQSKDMK